MDRDRSQQHQHIHKNSTNQNQNNTDWEISSPKKNNGRGFIDVENLLNEQMKQILDSFVIKSEHSSMHNIITLIDQHYNSIHDKNINSTRETTTQAKKRETNVSQHLEDMQKLWMCSKCGTLQNLKTKQEYLTSKCEKIFNTCSIVRNS